MMGMEDEQGDRKMESEELNDLIIELIKVKEPPSIEQLVKLITAETNIREKDAFKIVLAMENAGKIRLTRPPDKIPSSFHDYVFSEYTIWFWSIIIISVVTMSAVFTVTSDNSSLIFLRYIFGTVFLLFLPGYSLIKVLFPGKNIGNLERIVLSMGLSLSLLPVVGIFLNYTPWGIGLAPVSIFLLVFTISLALIGILKEYEQINENVEKVF